MNDELKAYYYPAARTLPQPLQEQLENLLRAKTWRLYNECFGLLNADPSELRALSARITRALIAYELGNYEDARDCLVENP